MTGAATATEAGVGAGSGAAPLDALDLVPVFAFSGTLMEDENDAECS